MELNLSELDNVNTMNPYENFDHNFYQQNGPNYWEKMEQKNTEIKTKKKKVTFDDILLNMNLVVNQEGILQFMGPKQEEVFMDNSQRPSYQPINNPSVPVYSSNIKKVQYEQMRQSPPQNINSEPLDPTVKHSYIYNKYFKDYVDPNASKPTPRVPQTIEEYRQMLLEERIKAIQQKQRIDQIKSKKMLFVSSPGYNVNPRNIQASNNNLRNMSFR
jgi:hypothetical protein